MKLFFNAAFWGVTLLLGYCVFSLIAGIKPPAIKSKTTFAPAQKVKKLNQRETDRIIRAVKRCPQTITGPEIAPNVRKYELKGVSVYVPE